MPPKKKEEKKEEAPVEVVEESGTYVFEADGGAQYTGQVVRRQDLATVVTPAGGAPAGTAAAPAAPSAGGAAAAPAPGGSSGYVLKRHGQGAFVSPRLTYEGGWKDDLMHGEGRLTFRLNAAKETESFVGSFVDGAFDGHGTYTFANGSVYTGGWRCNRMHGEGTFFDAVAGQTWAGKFYNGSGPGLTPLAAGRVALAA